MLTLQDKQLEDRPKPAPPSPRLDSNDLLHLVAAEHLRGAAELGTAMMVMGLSKNPLKIIQTFQSPAFCLRVWQNCSLLVSRIKGPFYPHNS